MFWETELLFAVLTLGHLSLLADIPSVEGSSLLSLHGRALVEMLGEVGLIQACSVNYLSLGDIVLL